MVTRSQRAITRGGDTGLSTNRFMFHPHCHFIGMSVSYCCRNCACSVLPFRRGTLMGDSKSSTKNKAPVRALSRGGK